MRKKILFLLMFVIGVNFIINAQLVVHPEIPASSIPKFAGYTVEARMKGDATWKTISVYTSRSRRNAALPSGFATFDFNGTVEVRVTNAGSGMASAAKIRPYSENIVPTSAVGKVLIFELSSPKYLYIDFGDLDGFKTGRLALLTDPLEVNPPQPGDANVIYLGPGVHKKGTDARIVTKVHPQYGVERDEIILQNNETLYLAGGAVFEGQVTIKGVSNVKVLGRGFIDHRKYFASDLSAKDTFACAMLVWGSTNVTIDGITASEAFWRPISVSGSNTVNVTNYKGFSFREYSDGFSVNSTTALTANRVYMDVADDPLSIYNSRNIGYDKYIGNTQDCSWSNMVLIAQHGPGVVIGWHGNRNAAAPDIMQRNTFNNITVLESQGVWEIFTGGAIALNAGGENIIRDMTFNDITLENTVSGQRLFNIRTFNDAFYEGGFPAGALGKSVTNITVNRLKYVGTQGLDKSEISCWQNDASRPTSGIHFNDLYYQGTKVDASNYTSYVNVGSAVTDVTWGVVIPVTSIAITSPNTSTNGLDMNLTISAAPTGASTGATWAVTNGTGSATVVGNVLTPTSNGTVTLTATSTSNVTKTATQTLTISGVVPELLLNGNFESPANATKYRADGVGAAVFNGAVANWFTDADATDTGREPATGVSGSNAAYSMSGDGATYQIVGTIPAGSNTYTLKGQGKISWVNGTATTLNLTTYFYTVTGSGASAIKTKISTNEVVATMGEDYKEILHTFTIPASEAGKTLAIGFDLVRIGGTETAYANFDNFSLKGVLGAPPVLVTSVVVTPATSALTVGGSLQLTTTVLPSNANNKAVTWSISGAGATISQTGLLSASAAGTVVVRATAQDGSAKFGEATITISNAAPVLVTGITVNAPASTITTKSGTLQLAAAIIPSNASNKNVTWSVNNSNASISASGLLTAIADGSVTARATAQDGSAKFGEITITISGQTDVPPTTISLQNGNFELPANTIKYRGDGVGAAFNGNVPNWFTDANVTDGGREASTTIEGANSAYCMTGDGATYQIVGTVDAAKLKFTLNCQALVTWASVQSDVLYLTTYFYTVTGAGASAVKTIVDTKQTLATQASGLANLSHIYTAPASFAGKTLAIGFDIVRASGTGTSWARFDKFTLLAEATASPVLVTSINVTGATSISTKSGTAQMTATVLPSNATNQALAWSVNNSNAIVSASGLVTALANGTVIVRATAQDGSAKFGEATITITNQVIAAPVALLNGNFELPANTIKYRGDGVGALFNGNVPSWFTDANVTDGGREPSTEIQGSNSAYCMTGDGATYQIVGTIDAANPQFTLSCQGKVTWSTVQSDVLYLTTYFYTVTGSGASAVKTLVDTKQTLATQAGGLATLTHVYTAPAALAGATLAVGFDIVRGSGSGISWAAFDNFTLTQASSLKSATAIESVDDAVKMDVYPNPISSGILKIDFGTEISGTVSLFDMNGRLVYLRNINNQGSANINYNELKTGVLIMRVATNNKVCVSKVVVK